MVVDIKVPGGQSGCMAKEVVWTDHVFDTEDEAWKYILKHYSSDTNYVMRNARKSGKKVSVGVRKKGKKYIIVIVVG